MKEYEATVIIPTYNEEGAIEGLLNSIREGGYTGRYEFIVVNDGSTDTTGDLVKRFPVRLITHCVNKGYGAALKTGIRAAQSEKIVIMDGDGQHSPANIPEIVRLLDFFPMVIGERDEKSHQVSNRRLGKRLIRGIGEFLVEQRLPDYNSGFRAFRRRHIRGMLSIMPNGFSFSTTSTLAFLKHGYDIGTLPITVTERVGRKSNVRFIRDGRRTVLLILRIVMLFNPMKIFLPASFALGVLGLAWTTLGIAAYAKIPNGGVLSLISSMMLFFIGLVADQVSMLNLRENTDEDR